MLDERMEKAINKQINAELYSSYLYLSMSSYYDDIELSGFANWMRVQAEEEKFHAMKMFDYVIERGGRVKLLAIDAPQVDWDSPMHPLEHTCEHEVNVTAMINKLMDLAMEIKDYASVQFLQWYVAEQVEEEASSQAIRGKLKLAGLQGNGIFMMDKELSSRVYNPPVKEENKRK